MTKSYHMRMWHISTPCCGNMDTYSLCMFFTCTLFTGSDMETSLAKVIYVMLN